MFDVQGIEKTTPPDKEQEAARLLVDEIAPQIDALRARWEGPPAHAAEHGSALAGDDKHSRPYHVSHVAWLSIGHAIDNLVALRTLTVQGHGNEITVASRPFAAYPSVRAALENACSAIWLIGPESRDDRLMRRFRQLLTDAANRDKAVQLIDPHAEPSDNRRAEVRRLIDARGLSIEACKKSVSFSEVVRGAHTIMGLDEAKGEAIWRMLSGLTHGDSWASHMITDRDDVSVLTDDEVYTVRTTSSLTNIANLTSMALSVTTNAIIFFDTRRTRLT